jgi:hypothetical protein
LEHIGSDRVIVRGSRVIVLSRADMPAWEVRAFRRAAIHFRGERFYVRAKERRDGGFRYTLERWPDDLEDIGGPQLEYGPSFVAERDGARRAVAVARRLRLLLVPLYPLIGFLPSEVKRRLADGYGISSERATEQSLWLEAALALAAAAMFTISTMSGLLGRFLGTGELPWADSASGITLFVLVVSAVDLVVRYARILAESERSYGFWEWLFRRPG